MRRPGPGLFAFITLLASLTICAMVIYAVAILHVDAVLIGASIAVLSICGIAIRVMYRWLYRTVPDGYVGVLVSVDGDSIRLLQGTPVLVWPWEKFEKRDIREKHYTHTFDCVTGDHIRVALRINLRWQIDHEQLESFFNLGIDAPQLLEKLVGAQLAFEVFSRPLYKLQEDQHFIQFHLERHLGWYPYSASLHGLIVQEPRILSISLPAAITSVAEQAERNRLEQEIARGMRVINYYNRLIETQALAQELQTLDHVIQVASPRAVDFTETLQLARRWPEITAGSPR